MQEEVTLGALREFWNTNHLFWLNGGGDLLRIMMHYGSKSYRGNMVLGMRSGYPNFLTAMYQTFGRTYAL